MIPLTVLLAMLLMVIPFGPIVLGILILCAVIFIIRKIPDDYITPFWKNVLQWAAGLLFILWLCNIFGVFGMSMSV